MSTRRRLLRAGFATVSIGSLAGCTGNGEEPDEPEPEPEPVPEPEPHEEEVPPAQAPEDAPPPEDTTPIAQFQYDAQNTGAVETTAPADGDPDWQTLLARSTAGLGVTDQQIIAFGGRYSGSFDPADGTEQWRVILSGRFNSPPVLTSDTAYATSTLNDSEEFGVVALATDTGGIRWGALEEFSSSSSPIVTDETVFVTGSQDDTSLVVALDAVTGDEVWRTSFEEVRSITGPAIANGIVYATASISTNENEDDVPAMIVALDQDEGDEVWRADITHFPSDSPTVHDGVVYAGTYDSPVGPDTGDVWAVDAATGEEIWAVTISGGVSGSIAVADSGIYVPGGDLLAALTHEGDTRWQRPGDSFYAPTVTSDAIVATDGRDLVSYELDGEERWRFEPESRRSQDEVYAGIRSPPFVSEGTVYMVSHAGHVYAV